VPRVIERGVLMVVLRLEIPGCHEVDDTRPARRPARIDDLMDIWSSMP
jgi:hypothetical protein